MFTAATVICALLASSLALPQYDYGYGEPSDNGKAPKIVKVGDGKLAFEPEAVFADVGDIIEFHFYAKNHSVVQSSLEAPCSPLAGGINSGFKPSAPGLAVADLPTFRYTVTDTKPVWIHCSQAGGAHCNAGMVFAINCGADGAPNSLDNFKAAAKAAVPGATPAPAAAQPDTTTYPGITIPPEPVGEVKTAVISVETSTWTTTYTSFPNSPNPTPVSLIGNLIEVTVGEAGALTFEPSHITASVRDRIRFTFKSKNHTVTQSSFADPCRKLEFTSKTGQIGVDSGFMAVPEGATTFPSYEITVNDTAPLWFYCRQTAHCGRGMVFSINSDETAGSQRTFDAFQSLAKQINGSATAGTPGGATPPPSGAYRVSAGAVLGLVGLAFAVLL